MDELGNAPQILDISTLPLPLRLRPKNSHKGDYGQVLIIGGGPGMPGAVSLCAKAALRVGAGSVTVATWPDHAKGALSLVPEAMISAVTSPRQLKPLLAKATVCVIGPGLSQNRWAQRLFAATIDSQLPLLIDASALGLLAKRATSRANWVLTPHAGEAGSLLASSAKEVQSDRLKAANTLQNLYQGVVVLKGQGTLIQTDETCFLCQRGNPGMATAGMGDVLSGIIAGLMAQGLSLADAAKLGVWLHATAGDSWAAAQGERGMLASDLLDILPSLLNGLTS